MTNGAVEAIDQIMEVFDNETEIVRTSIRVAIRVEFDRHLARVTRLLSRKLREPHPGSDWGIRALRLLEQCSGGSSERLARLVEEAWQEAWDAGPDPACRGSARDVGRRRLGVVWPESENGGIVGMTRVVPSLSVAVSGPILAIACPILRIESAGTGGIAQRIEEAQSRHEQIRSALGTMLGNEKLRKGDVDLITCAADLGTVVLAARDAGELTDSAGTLAMPGLLAAVGIGAVAAAAADVGTQAMAQREQVALGHLAACRESAEREFLREVDEFLVYVRDVTQWRAYQVFSTGREQERQIRIRQGITELLELRGEILNPLVDDQVLGAETGVARVLLEVLGPIRIARDGQPVHFPETTLRVLLRLIVAAPNPVSADDIYRDVWGLPSYIKRPGRSHRLEVQKRIVALRKGLDPDAIVTEHSSYRLVLDAAECDWRRFESLLDSAATADPPAGELFDQALGLWRGDPFGTLRSEEFAQDLASHLGRRYQEAERGASSARAAAVAGGDLIRRAFPSLDVVLTVRKGDLFEQADANLAVGFGDTFDTNTDQDKIISRDSVQGQLLSRVYSGDRARLDSDLETGLDKVCPAVVEVLGDKPRGKLKRYAMGTTVPLPLPADDRRRAFAFVHCRQDEGFVTSSTSEDLDAALSGLWAAVRRHDMYKPLALPVVGSGAARVLGLNRTRLITTIIASFLGGCRENGRSATELRILVPEADLARTGIDEIRRYVHGLDPDGREPA